MKPSKSKVSPKVRTMTMQNLYKTIKHKRQAMNLEKHIYTMSSGYNGAYIDTYRKIMLIIVPKKIKVS